MNQIDTSQIFTPNINILLISKNLIVIFYFDIRNNKKCIFMEGYDEGKILSEFSYSFLSFSGLPASPFSRKKCDDARKNHQDESNLRRSTFT